MNHIVSSVELSILMMVMSLFAANTLDSYKAKCCYKLSYPYKLPILTSQLHLA